MWTPAKLKNGLANSDNYGFGWFIDSIRGHRIIEHEGEWQGFATQISRYVDDHLSVIVLTNIADADPDRIAHQVAGLYVPELKPLR
jgi:hypothetical protein